MVTLASINEVVSRIDDDAMRDACLRVMDEVARRIGDGRPGNWTFGSIAKWVGLEPSDPLLQSALAFLAGRKDARLLDMHFLYFDPQDEEHVGEPIGDDEVAEAYRTGYLIDPVTGEQVQDFEASLSPYFVPSVQLVVQ